MGYVAIDKWEPSDGIILEDAANRVARSHQSALVVAGPGAGKTELLAQRACFLLQTNTCAEPHRILAISFKKDAAANLKDRVQKRCGDIGHVRFVSMTYDAFAKGLLDQFRNALPDELRPDRGYIVDDVEIINQACLLAGYRSYVRSASVIKNEQGAGLSNVAFPLSGKSWAECAWRLLVKGSNSNKPCLSFHMINKLAEYIIRLNVFIQRALRATYTHVFLDEFQDTTSLQYALVMTCFHGSKVIITAVGDQKQRIMTWAGAKTDVFDCFLKDFDAERFELIMNHRSAPRLVELQKQMYASLQVPNQSIQCSNKWKREDGNIDLYIEQDDESEANSITNSILERIQGGIKPREICILCKQKPQDYSNLIITRLANHDIKARYEADYQDLLKEPIIQILISCIRLGIKRRNPSDDIMLNTLAARLYDIDEEISSEKAFDWQRNFYSQLNSWAEQFTKPDVQADAGAFVHSIIEFWGLDRLKAHFPMYSQGSYLEELLEKFIHFLDDAYSRCHDWMGCVEDIEGNNSIPIMTIHKSKGLEYECVYFLGLEDSAFWSFKNQPLQDRCAFFVALSRAKSSVAFTFCNYRSSTKYPKQSHSTINEFFELLQQPGIATIHDKQDNQKESNA